jgi:hypothetical protein
MTFPNNLVLKPSINYLNHYLESAEQESFGNKIYKFNGNINCFIKFILPKDDTIPKDSLRNHIIKLLCQLNNVPGYRAFMSKIEVTHKVRLLYHSSNIIYEIDAITMRDQRDEKNVVTFYPEIKKIYFTHNKNLVMVIDFTFMISQIKEFISSEKNYL